MNKNINFDFLIISVAYIGFNLGVSAVEVKDQGVLKEEIEVQEKKNKKHKPLHLHATNKAEEEKEKKARKGCNKKNQKAQKKN